MVTIFGYIDVYFNLWNLKIVFLRYVILMNSFSWLLFWLMSNLHGFSAISESKIFISCVLRGVKFRSNVNPKWNPKKCIIWLSPYANRKCHPDKNHNCDRFLILLTNERTKRNSFWFNHKWNFHRRNVETDTDWTMAYTGICSFGFWFLIFMI